MFVIKRDGKKETVKFDKITARIQKLCYGLSPDHVQAALVAQKVIEGVFDGVTTTELDNLAAETAASLTTRHPDFAQLASRIAISNLHKNTKKGFTDTMRDLYNYIDPKTGKKASLVAEDVMEVIEANSDLLDSSIIYDRDFGYDYFGFKTLEKSYLLRINGKVVERPQHMLMRVSVGIHKNDVESAIETYNLMSERWFTHATPTLFNAGTPKPQLSSCFLLQMKSDSIEGIYDTLKNTAQISQSAGGIGISIHNIRATGSYIRGTNGTSNGIVPMLRVFNDTARYVDQGGGKRKGSFAVYLEPWHADIFEFDFSKPVCSSDNRTNCDGYRSIRDLLKRHATQFRKPVLVIHGDTPAYCLHQPYHDIPNLWRLNAPGDYKYPDASEVTFDANNPDTPFTVTNLLDRKPVPAVCDASMLGLP